MLQLLVHTYKTLHRDHNCNPRKHPTSDQSTELWLAKCHSWSAMVACTSPTSDAWDCIAVTESLWCLAVSSCGLQCDSSASTNICCFDDINIDYIAGTSCKSAYMCAGLSLLNLSLDTLRADRFEQMTRRRGHERVLETLDLALSLGFDPVKVSFQQDLCSEVLVKEWG